ncbi:Rieske (2Fe-2S) domain protein [Burkholderia sp. H160]|nr:Rieske (2Fe-2S) domain protein [Burkholderia sp. H160]
MKPTGWFQIGWSAEIAPGAVRPLKYFGHELVAFRTASGELSVLDAHCPHMGAHLGYGGRVVDDCIQCPYHGWRFDGCGSNTLIPYQEGTIRKRLRQWHVLEQHEIIFLWHDPAGGPPREGWLPHLFDFPDAPASLEDFYPSYVNQAFVYSPGERLHPQVVVENSADTMHFRYSHGAPEDPELLWFNADEPIWRSSMGFKSPKNGEIAMRMVSHVSGVGLSFTVFDHHRFGRRLVLSCTPVDDQHSDLRVTYFFPRDPVSPDVMPEQLRAAARETVLFFEQDALIWRHQKFVQQPIFAKQDVKAYTALRKWSDQFYEVTGAATGPMPIADEGEHGR